MEAVLERQAILGTSNDADGLLYRESPSHPQKAAHRKQGLPTPDLPILCMTTDQQRWQQIRLGDERSFEALFRTWYKPLCAYSGRILADLEEAENVVQELFCQLWERRAEMTVPDNPRAYLYRAVLNRSLNALRAQAKTVSMETTDETQPEATQPAHSLEAGELEQLYLAAVEDMPPARRQIFCLSRWEGKTYAEIAATLELSVKTVENQMGKALGFLRMRLGEYLVTLLPLLSLLTLTLGSQS